MSSHLRDNRYLVAQNARVVVEARLETLEAEHAEFQDKLRDIERSVKWLPAEARVYARHRLRVLGLKDQLGPFEGLHAVIEGDAA